jgi:hypothetical protein
MWTAHWAAGQDHSWPYDMNVCETATVALQSFSTRANAMWASLGVGTNAVWFRMLCGFECCVVSTVEFSFIQVLSIFSIKTDKQIKRWIQSNHLFFINYTPYHEIQLLNVCILSAFSSSQTKLSIFDRKRWKLGHPLKIERLGIFLARRCMHQLN